MEEKDFWFHSSVFRKLYANIVKYILCTIEVELNSVDIVVAKANYIK